MADDTLISNMPHLALEQSTVVTSVTALVILVTLLIREYAVPLVMG